MTNNNFDDNTILWSPSLNALSTALDGDGIVSGAGISKGTGDFETDVASGTGIINNATVSIGATTLSHSDTSAMSSTETRIDLITADTGGTASVTEGTAADDPVAPDTPTDEILLGYWQIAGDDTILSTEFDIPPLVGNVTTLFKDGGDYEIDAAEFAGGAGTADQLLSTDGSAASWTDRITDGTDNTDVSGSRSFSTWYQNTDDSARLVYVSIDRSFSVDINTTQSAQEVLDGGSGTGADMISFIVPVGHYYRVVTINDGAAILFAWYESNLE